MNIRPLTIPRDRVEGAVLALGLLSLLAACGDSPTTADVDFLPPQEDAGVIGADARAPQSREEPCNTSQCMQYGGGQALPPTTFRRLVCDQAPRPNPP